MFYKRQDGNAFIKRYCDGSLTDKAAFALESRITIDFFIKDNFKSSVAFFYLGNDEKVLISRKLNSERNENGYSVFSVTMDSVEITDRKRRGLFFYHFETETEKGRVYTCTDGVNCTLEKHFCNEWQLSVYSEEYDSPSWFDGVFNHVGADSIYFNKFGKYTSVGAYQSKSSPFYNWFSFGNYPNEYDSWWGVKNLPKIKPNEDFNRYICDIVIPKYMSMGVFGWRFDVVDELSENFTERIVQSIKNNKKDAVVIGEVWEDASNKIAYNERKQYFLGRQLDSVTNYPLRDAIIEYVLNGNSKNLKLILQTLYEHYPPEKLLHIMNIVGTHDTERILNILSDEDKGHKNNTELSNLCLSDENRLKAIKRLKHAYLLLAFMPGIPCIYYGDEAGLEGWHDPFNRRPFPWKNISRELHDWFVRVNKLRLHESLFKAKKLRIFDTSDNTFAVERYNDKGRMVILSNMVNFKIYEKIIDIVSDNEYNDMFGISAESVRIYKKVDEKWELLI